MKQGLPRVQISMMNVYICVYLCVHRTPAAFTTAYSHRVRPELSSSMGALPQDAVRLDTHSSPAIIHRCTDAVPWRTDRPHSRRYPSYVKRVPGRVVAESHHPMDQTLVEIHARSSDPCAMARRP